VDIKQGVCKRVSPSSRCKLAVGSYVNDTNFQFNITYRLGQQTLIIHTIAVCVHHRHLTRPTNLTVLAKSNRRVP
jgi:hypothetical protein